MKNITLLGASGSIGTQTIDIIKAHPDEFNLIAVSVGRQIDKLSQYLASFDSIKYAYSIEKNDELEAKYPEITFFYGGEGLLKIASLKEADLVVNALVGFVGFLPSLVAIRAHCDLALANKETLVAGGDLIKQALKENNVNIYPIDSEHSAILQCLQGNNRAEVAGLIITASGGAFRDLTRQQLKEVKKIDALKHPTWQMGAKITIDSATMMNKAFEIMEAHYLFDIDYKDIDVLLHPESIVHSMVEFKDGAVLAQLGEPDMHVPIQYALCYPRHAAEFSEKRLNLANLATLNFKELDEDRYPFVRLIKKIAPFAGNVGAVINGANDCAVNLFLNDKISFLDIENAVNKALKKMHYISNPDEEDIVYSYNFGYDLVNSEYGGN